MLSLTSGQVANLDSCLIGLSGECLASIIIGILGCNIWPVFCVSLEASWVVLESHLVFSTLIILFYSNSIRKILSFLFFFYPININKTLSIALHCGCCCAVSEHVLYTLFLPLHLSTFHSFPCIYITYTKVGNNKNGGCNPIKYPSNF